MGDTWPDSSSYNEERIPLSEDPRLMCIKGVYTPKSDKPDLLGGIAKETIEDFKKRVERRVDNWYYEGWHERRTWEKERRKKAI